MLLTILFLYFHDFYGNLLIVGYNVNLFISLKEQKTNFFWLQKCFISVPRNFTVLSYVTQKGGTGVSIQMMI